MEVPNSSPSISSPGSAIRISVIIPALNEERYLALCLQALAENDFAKHFEVIVVDNGSRDKTIEIANGFRSVLDLNVLQRSNVYISALRNFGAAHARGEILAFIDADCIAPPNWLRTIESTIETCPDESIIGAHYAIPQRSSWVACAWYGDTNKQKVGVVNYVPAGDLITRRDTFSKIGGFDEAIQTNEDSELCQRAARAGIRTKAFPNLSVEHWGTPQTVSGFYRKQRWHGTHVFKVFLRARGKQNFKPVALGAYSVLALVLCIVGAILAVTRGRYDLLSFAIFMLILIPSAVGFSMAVRRKRFRYLPSIAWLTLVYGIARGVCLFDVRTWLLNRRSY